MGYDPLNMFRYLPKQVKTSIWEMLVFRSLTRRFFMVHQGLSYQYPTRAFWKTFQYLNTTDSLLEYFLHKETTEMLTMPVALPQMCPLPLYSEQKSFS